MQLDAENEAALQALRSPGPLAASQGLRLRGFTTCPHCQQGFGSASFAIHVRRCRALYPPPEEEPVGESESAAPAKPVKPKKPKPLYSLVDLCLRFITKNFQTVCMDRIASQPEEEAALIESLPTSLVHRIIVNLVNDLDEKDAKRRAKIKRMETDAAALQREKQRLETFRQQTMTARVRLNEQEQTNEQLRRELEARTQELAAEGARSQQLRSQGEGFEKLQHRLEAKINSLNLENDTLKTELRVAQKKEMDTIKQLATASKKLD
uniref:Uncharacterized protein n=1 Tax=Globisporangium ultimum (strain ATCC 200006 / CBS 805.95 / DAOM BR144) TaxID=431595 RepID=K3WDD0_GLOUD